MQYTRGEPKDFNGLGGKKSLAAEWDRWIADREGGGSMRTARELSQRRRGLRHFGANGLIRSRGRRVLSAVSLRELQLRRTARNRAWLIAMAMVSTLCRQRAGAGGRVEAECRNVLHRSSSIADAQPNSWKIIWAASGPISC